MYCSIGSRLPQPTQDRGTWSGRSPRPDRPATVCQEYSATLPFAAGNGAVAPGELCRCVWRFAAKHNDIPLELALFDLGAQILERNDRIRQQHHDLIEQWFVLCALPFAAGGFKLGTGLPKNGGSQ
jgi:hypothetical protein